MLAAGEPRIAAAQAAGDPVIPRLRVVADGFETAPNAAADGETLDGLIPTPSEPSATASEPEVPVDGDYGSDGQIAVVAEPALDDGAMDGVGTAIEQPADSFLAPIEADAASNAAAAPAAEVEDADPFAASGLKVGSFDLFPEISTDIVATDNVRQSVSGRQSDTILEVKPSFVLRSDWNVHRLEATLAGDARLHQEFDSEDGADWTAGLRGRFDVTSRTNFEAEGAWQLTEDGRGDINVPDAALSPAEVRTLSLAARLNHRFNRLSLLFELSQSSTDHGALELADGSIDLREDEDTDVTGGRFRASYEWIDGNDVFGEYQRTRTLFEAASEADGIYRDGNGDLLRVGFKAAFSPLYDGEVSVGYRSFDPDSEALDAIAGIVVDASLAYRPTDHTRIGLKATSDIEGSSLADTAGALSQTFAVDVRHEMTRRFIVLAGFGVGLKTYEGIDASERSREANLGLEYILNRNWALTGGYEHLASEIDGTGAGDGTITENRLRVGARWRQ